MCVSAVLPFHHRQPSTAPIRLQAQHHIRSLRGTTKPQLFLANNTAYVVKLAERREAARLLVNEWLVARLGRAIGLNIPEPALIEVDTRLLPGKAQLELPFPIAAGVTSAAVGFGSKYASSAAGTFDYVPAPALRQVKNAGEFAGILLLDQWLCNCDRRQVVFSGEAGRLEAHFIDHGHCFNGTEWSFPDSPLRGLYDHAAVYESITGWGSFEPWLSRIVALSRFTLQAIGEEVPAAWRRRSEERSGNIAWLIGQIDSRRRRLREPILAIRSSAKRPFPNWVEGVARKSPAMVAAAVRASA